jgi:hypothetical protein
MSLNIFIVNFLVIINFEMRLSKNAFGDTNSWPSPNGQAEVRVSKALGTECQLVLKSRDNFYPLSDKSFQTATTDFKISVTWTSDSRNLIIHKAHRVMGRLMIFSINSEMIPTKLCANSDILKWLGHWENGLWLLESSASRPKYLTLYARLDESDDKPTFLEFYISTTSSRSEISGFRTSLTFSKESFFNMINRNELIEINP